MVPDLIRIIAEYGPLQIIPLLIITVMRPFGLLFAFIPFFWAFGNDAMVRMSVAFAFGLPTLAASVSGIEELVADQDFWQMAVVAPKEVAIGMLLGFLMSLPFWALRYAGTVIATYKGEADGGFETPQDGTVDSVAALFELIAIAAFVYAGGLWMTVVTLYASYDIWPLMSALPVFSANASAVLFDTLASTLMITVQTALPILIVLIIADFVLAIGGRIGRRYQLGELSFIVKNFTTVLILPVVVYLVWITNVDIDLASAAGLDIMRALFE